MIGTGRREFPSDRAAHAALLDAYEAAGDWQRLYDELATSLGSSQGEKRTAVLAKMGDVSTKMGDKTRALAHYRELVLAGISSEDLLGAVEALAESASDLAMLEQMIDRRVADAREPHGRCSWLERLGRLQAERIGNLPKAASSFKRARVIAEGAGALALAAALSGQAGPGKVVCVVSGGNINLDKLAAILTGATS